MLSDAQNSKNWTFVILTGKLSSYVNALQRNLHLHDDDDDGDHDHEK